MTDGTPGSSPPERYDVMVVGAGIAGMEASITLGDAGFKTLLVEREPTIGGKVLLLSKVFPTLDCASCISGTKTSRVSHHPNIDMRTYTEVEAIRREPDGSFLVRLREKPRYVDMATCTGCGDCEKACPIIVPKENDFGLRGRKSIYIPFDTGVPKKAVLDMKNCIYCMACERACPADAIDFLQAEKVREVRVGAVLLSTGFNLFPAEKKAAYHYGEYPNVVTAMQMDRLVGPTRPYNSVMRLSDGKEPANIAYALCTGSRDLTVGNPRCSQVCCMYSMKQAQLLMGILPTADITLYYMDIRAYGKGFEEFYQQTKAMGVKFVRGRVAKIEETSGNDLRVYHEDTEGRGVLVKSDHDLVVLSIGLLPNPGIATIFTNETLELDEMGWIKMRNETQSPSMTSIDGVFVAGCASGPKDIPDSIAEASSAVSQCIAYLTQMRGLAPSGVVPEQTRQESNGEASGLHREVPVEAK